MQCVGVITNVAHMTAKSFKNDSFFIIETNANEAGQVLGQCYVDPHSMFYFAEWIREGSDSRFNLLVSLDAKYAMIRHRDEDGGVYVEEHETVLQLQNNNLWGSIDDFRDALTIELADVPDKWPLWGYKPARSKIKRSRVSFKGLIVLEFDAVAMTSGWVDRIQSAPDWALVWLYAAQDSIKVSDRDSFVEDLKTEIALRVGTGRSVQSDFSYDLKGMTLKELERVRTRAVTKFDRLKNLFTIGARDFQAALDEITKSVVNLDGALELYVAACWDSNSDYYRDIQPILWDLVCKYMDDSSSQTVGMTEDDF